MPRWSCGSPWWRSFMWAHHLERHSNPPQCHRFVASPMHRGSLRPVRATPGGVSVSMAEGLGRAVPLWSKPACLLRVHGMPTMPLRRPSIFWGCRWFAARWTEKRSRQPTYIACSAGSPMTRMGYPAATSPPTVSCVVAPPGQSACPAIVRSATTVGCGPSNVRFAWAALASEVRAFQSLRRQSHLLRHRALRSQRPWSRRICRGQRRRRCAGQCSSSATTSSE